MIVAEDTIRQIKSGRVKRRILTFGMRTGIFGERKPCPLRFGGVYTLVPASPVGHKRRLAERDAWRAQAVLDFIDLCDGTRHTEKMLTVEVTVTGEPFEGAPGVWFVPIALGDLSGQKDRSLFLAGSGGDYTLTASRQSVPGDPEVMFPSDADLVKAHRRLSETRSRPASMAVQAMREKAETCRGVMTSMKTRNRLKLIERELARLAEEVDG